MSPPVVGRRGQVCLSVGLVCGLTGKRSHNIVYDNVIAIVAPIALIYLRYLALHAARPDNTNIRERLRFLRSYWTRQHDDDVIAIP